MDMVRTLLRTWAALLVASALVAAPAFADPLGDFGTAVQSANIALKHAMTPKPKGAVAQVPVPPVQQQPGAQAGLPTGLTYMADASIARPFGDVGTFGDKMLPGGVDGVLGYGFNPHMRLVAEYYELQHYPVGFNSGKVPLFLPPAFPPSPINPSCVDLGGATSATCAGIARPIDVATKDKYALFLFENLFNLGKIAGHDIPVVVTPTYVSRWSIINGSGGNGDVIPFVDSSGAPHFGVNTRTAQLYAVAVTLPFLKTPKMFGTFTAAPDWLVHRAGLNQTNHMQIYQILYLEYDPAANTKVFFEPLSSRTYLPLDSYPEHLATYFLGASQIIGKYGFIQVVLNGASPTNYSPYGVKQLNCLALPCGANTLPQIGGLKATQLQIQFGIGSPSVIQL
jgi:hypothetical protein